MNFPNQWLIEEGHVDPMELQHGEITRILTEANGDLTADQIYDAWDGAFKPTERSQLHVMLGTMVRTGHLVRKHVGYMDIRYELSAEEPAPVFEEYKRGAGRPPRDGISRTQSVIEILEYSRRPLTAHDIADRFQEDTGKELADIGRILARLLDRGLVAALPQQAGPKLYVRAGLSTETKPLMQHALQRVLELA